jgi:F-type H+-transporting ATPase subunit alpha
LVELLKQPLNSPMPVELQVISVYAGTSGVLDDIPVPEVKRFERELHDYFTGRYSGLLGEIRESGRIPDDDTLEVAVGEFHDGFVAALESSAADAASDAAAAAADPSTPTE